MSAAARLTAAEKRIAAGVTPSERAYANLGKVTRTALEAAGLGRWAAAEDRAAGHVMLGKQLDAALEAILAAREAEIAAADD